MAKIKLTESVSVSELKHMREVEGLSNAEIAKRVGCAVSTAIAYIGKQPVEMTKRNQMAGLRRVKELPPLTETKTEIPDMPRESFKERCERLMAKADERKADAEADKAREAHCKALDMAAQLSHGIVPVIVHGTVYDVPRVAYEVIKEEALKINAKESEPLPCRPEDNGNELHALVEELKVMFSLLSVLDYLKCKLYELGTPHIIYADREDYLTEIHRLLGMQEGVAQHD